MNYLPEASSFEAPITAIDLFCGAGGFSLAAMNVGTTVLAALESNKYACQTYVENFIKNKSHAPILFEKDITRYSPEEFMHNARIKRNTVDIILGGPPCQGFSIHRIKNAGVDDPRNELLLQYFKYVETIAPRAFVIENVPGMLWPRHAKYTEKFYNLARKAGYDVLPPVSLNAKDYGVPQNRKRIFILGFRDKRPNFLEWPPHALNFHPQSHEVLDQGFPAWKNASEVFIQPISVNDPNAVHMNSKPHMIDVFKSTPLNGGSRRDSVRILPCHEQHDGHMDVYGRIDLNQPGPTMTTACINPSKGRFLHPTEHHGITVRHAARFQTFPEWFVFKGGLMASGVQIGNAVPIKLGEVVLQSITKSILQSSTLCNSALEQTIVTRKCCG